MPITFPPQLLDKITRKGSEIGVKLVPLEGATPASLSRSDWKWFATFAALNAGPVFVPN